MKKRNGFQAGDVIAYLRPPKYRIDGVTLVDGVPMAEMTMIEDDLGREGNWRQLGGPCSLEYAYLVEWADPCASDPQGGK